MPHPPTVSTTAAGWKAYILNLDAATQIARNKNKNVDMRSYGVCSTWRFRCCRCNSEDCYSSLPVKEEQERWTVELLLIRPTKRKGKGKKCKFGWCFVFRTTIIPFAFGEELDSTFVLWQRVKLQKRGKCDKKESELGLPGIPKRGKFSGTLVQCHRQ